MDPWMRLSIRPRFLLLPTRAFWHEVDAIRVLTDGRIVLRYTFYGKGRILSFNADGRLDITSGLIDLEAGTAFVILPQTDGSVLIGGELRRVDGKSAHNI